MPGERIGHGFSRARETRYPASLAYARSGLRFSAPFSLRSKFVPGERIELSHLAIHDFESCASTNSAIPAMGPRKTRVGGQSVYNTPAMGKKQKVLILVGPTSSGKSALAVELAKKLDGEIISADSRQVYRGLNIGTGKITKREMRGVRHHLLDVASPRRIFTAHEYESAARSVINEIAARGKLPIIAGGTGFYIDALVGRITLPNVPVNTKLRAILEKKTAMQLFALLNKRDKERAKNIDPHNSRRLIRALEIVSALGSVPHPPAHRASYDTLWIGIESPLSELLEKIKVRLSARIRQGMVGEAKKLRAGGLSWKRMESLGLEYRALARLLQNKITRKEFESELLGEIRRYAKRQITYWKRNKDILWFEKFKKTTIERHVLAWLKE